MKPCPHGFPKPANCWTCMEDGNLDPPPPQPKVEPHPREHDGPLLLTEDRARAVDLLAALDAAGWRIVRIDPAGLFDHPDHTRPFYEDEDRPDNCRELFLITEEWTP